MINAVRDLCGEDNRIKIRLGLRSDVYFLVRTSDESTDKIQNHIVWLDWSNHEILCVAAKRIATFFNEEADEQKLLAMRQINIGKEYFARIMDDRYSVGNGHWSNRPIHNILLSLCRRRPRDLVKLLSAAAREAHRNRRTKISSSDLQSVFENYSEERLQDISNEYKSEMPSVRSLLLSLRPTKRQQKTSANYLYTHDQLIKKLNDIRSNTGLNFTDRRPVTARNLLHFLYKIEFITARSDSEKGIQRRYFDQKRFLADDYADFGYSWEIHPAYRWALQPRSVHDVLETIEQG